MGGVWLQVLGSVKSTIHPASDGLTPRLCLVGSWFRVHNAAFKVEDLGLVRGVLADWSSRKACNVYKFVVSFPAQSQ